MRAPRLTLLPLVALSAAMLTLVSASALAAPVYKWVDERGVIHYSDQPHPQAKEVEITPTQTYSAPPAAAATGQSTAQQPTTGPEYTLCEIYRPENDEVFLNTDSMTAKIRLEPLLKPGHRVAFAIDGRRVAGIPQVGSEFIFSKLERGTHTLLMVVEDPQRKALCNAATITFHVRQPSTQAPNRANRPRF